MSAPAGELALIARAAEGGAVELVAPCPGVLVETPTPGAAAVGGRALAVLEVLGRRTRLLVPVEGSGVVREAAGRGPLGYGARVALLGAAIADAGAGLGRAGASTSAGSTTSGLALRAPSSGRFYRRAAPDQPAFAKDGDEIAAGQTVGLLEVMKTFGRIHYAGDGLPPRARVVRVVPADGADVEAGDVLLELAPIGP